MRDDIFKTIDFKQIRTIISKEKSDIEEWKKCNLIPFMLLEKESTYSVVYVVFRKTTSCGFSTAGTPEILYNRLLECIDNSEEILIFITHSDKNTEGWLIVRE
jgi:hypothetical protein